MGTPAHDTLKGTEPEPSGASGMTTSEAGVADGVRVGVVVAEGVACAVCVPDADGVTLGDGVAVVVPEADDVLVDVDGGEAPVDCVGVCVGAAVAEDDAVLVGVLVVVVGGVCDAVGEGVAHAMTLDVASSTYDDELRQ